MHFLLELRVLVIHNPGHATLDRSRDVFDVEEPAGTTPTAPRFVEGSATRFSKVGDGRVLRVDQFTKVEATCETL